LQLGFGNFLWVANATEVTTHRDLVYNHGGQVIAQRVAWNFGGYVYGDGQAAVSLQMELVEAALIQPFKDLVLFTDTGSPSATLLLNRGSTTGVRITSGPNWDHTKGAAYALEQHFTATAEAEYPLPQALRMLMDFQESISFSGGGPVRIARRAINGPPQIQTTFRQTEYLATQSGVMVGYLSQPNPLTIAPPKFPAFLVETPTITPHAPRRMGLKYQDYRVEYSYKFVSTSPLIAVPTLWVR
jgi:hypothetical protein